MISIHIFSKLFLLFNLIPGHFCISNHWSFNLFSIHFILYFISFSFFSHLFTILFS